MSRTLPLLTAVVLSALFVALAACGDGGGGEASPTPEPETTAAQTPTGPDEATPTQSATLAPGGSEFSRSASVSAEVGDESLTFEDGACVKGPDDAWLAVSVGGVGGAEYFLLVVGNLTGQEGAKSAKGGGVFTGDEIAVVTGTQSGTTFSLRSSEENKVTVAADLRSGEFIGTAIAGQPVSGSFKC